MKLELSAQYQPMNAGSLVHGAKPTRQKSLQFLHVFFLGTDYVAVFFFI